MTDIERPGGFTLGKTPVPNGTILIIGVRYENTEPGGDTRGRTNPKVYTYTFTKAGGLWYATGTGKVPQAAGWGAVERWLAKEGRTVESVQVVTETAQVYPSPVAPKPARIVAVLAAQEVKEPRGRATAEEMIKSGELRRDYRV